MSYVPARTHGTHARESVIFIHAGNHDQARSCANWLELHKDGWRYLNNGDELLGTDRPKVVCFGTYYQHPLRDRIRCMLEMHRAFVSRLEDR